MTGQRAVITGIGVVSPFGYGRETFWDHLVRGVSGTRAIHEFEPLGPCRVAAPVPDDGADALSVEDTRSSNAGRADPRRYAKVSRIAVAAAREALEDSGVSPGEGNVGVLVGSGAGGIDVGERQYAEYFAGDLHKISPYAIPVSIVGIVASEISIAFGLRGISHVLSTGCTSSTDAVGYAASLIRQGEADVLLTGGADACVTRGMAFVKQRYAQLGAALADPTPQVEAKDVAGLKSRAEKNPGNFLSQWTYGRALFDAGDNAAARPVLERAATLAPQVRGTVSPRGLLAQIAEKENDIPRARRELRQLLAVDHAWRRGKSSPMRPRSQGTRPSDARRTETLPSIS